MTTFLGTPVQVRDKIFGNLYLTEKHGGTAFDAEDAAVLRTLGAAAGVAIDNARLYDDARRRERWLAASSELTRTLLSGVDPAEVLHAFTATVRELSDADLVTLALPVTGTTDLVIESAEGRDADQVRGLALPDGTSLAAKVFASGENRQHVAQPGPAHRDGQRVGPRPRPGVRDSAGHPGAGARRSPGREPAGRHRVPGRHRRDDRRVRRSCRARPGDRRTPPRRRAVARPQRPRPHRARPARPGHPAALRRGLSLQSVLNRLTDRPDVAARVQRVVDDLDDTIKVVRSTIYALRESDRSSATGLRARLVTEVGRAAETLGFAPALRMSGLLDTDVSDEQREHLLAVVREALSNAARHAHATAVEVTAEATATTLRLRVADNGRGIGPDVTRRSGLGNLSIRAENLGGSCALTSNEPSGTVLEWTVPLHHADPA